MLLGIHHAINVVKLAVHPSKMKKPIDASSQMLPHSSFGLFSIGPCIIPVIISQWVIVLDVLM